jgi:5-(carboxyamino)imidazole ribonucleotide synthase
MIPPGSTIGVLGGGQLGRMFAMAARRLGYRVHTLAPDDDTPTGQVADREINASYDDLDAIRAFAQGVDVVTFEFENVSAAAAAAIVGCPAVLKTASFGYDGKGQVMVSAPGDLAAAWASLGRREAILEAFIDLDREISIIGARGVDGGWSHFAPIENAHARHILDVSVAPANVPAATAGLAVDVTRSVMDALEYVGILCIEFFVARDGSLLVNELAPRPHNSGHLTFDACRTSQFEQQLRAICALPLGSPELLQPAAMANLLGDVWKRGEPNWAAALAFPDVKLHLYGKSTPRPGRKMGHLTALAASPAEAKAQVLAAREALTDPLTNPQSDPRSAS